MHLFKNITLLNFMLLAAVILSLKFVVIPLSEFMPDFKGTPQSLSKNDDNSSIDDTKESQDKFQLLIEPGDLPSYSIVADQNLFHPERKIVIVEEKNKEKSPIEEDEETSFILYGTLVAGDIRVAFLESKVNQPPGKRQIIGNRRIMRSKAQEEKESEPEKPKKRFYEGDVIKGYTLKEINKENVVMVKGKEIITVKVYDPANPKKRIPVRSKALTKKQQTKKSDRTITPNDPREDTRKKTDLQRRRFLNPRENFPKFNRRRIIK